MRSIPSTIHPRMHTTPSPIHLRALTTPGPIHLRVRTIALPFTGHDASTLSNAGMRDLQSARRNSELGANVENVNKKSFSKSMTDLMDERIATHANAVQAAKVATSYLGSDRALDALIDEKSPIELSTRSSMRSFVHTKHSRQLQMFRLAI